MRRRVAIALSLLLVVPVATAAGRLTEPICMEQEAGPFVATLCAPAVPCVDERVGDGGRVALCTAAEEPAEDADGDGWSAAQGDCDDADPAVHPGAPEEPANGRDDDCDGTVDEPAGGDMDGDGVGLPYDCDDHDAQSHPGAAEVEDRKDNDCDGVADEGSQDSGDMDGDGVTLDGGDCDDLDGRRHPGASEIADRKDNDCNGLAEA